MSALERVIAALETAGCTVKRGRAQCPVHQSTALSVSIKQGRDAAMLHCFAGCATEDIVTEIGLTMPDLFDSEVPAGYIPPKRRQATPWDIVTEGPGVEHLLKRMVTEQALEAAPQLRERARLEHAAVVVEW